MLLRGNFIFVGPGDKAFLAASNFVNYIELGTPGSEGFFLIATIEEGEYRVSGRLFDENGKQVCEIEDNSVRQGGGVSLSFFPGGGYEIRDAAGRAVFRLALLEEPGTLKEVCLLQGRFFNERRELVAEGTSQDLLIYRSPAVLGKSGLSRGIVLGEPVSQNA